MQGIIDANRSYVAGYRKNARLMSLLSQVAERDAEVQAIGIAIRDHFEDRISQAIARWQAQGLAYSDLDPVYTANALAYMVDRFLAEWTAPRPAATTRTSSPRPSASSGCAPSGWPSGPPPPARRPLRRHAPRHAGLMRPDRCSSHVDASHAAGRGTAG